jgi:hypothetical protein
MAADVRLDRQVREQKISAGTAALLAAPTRKPISE